MHTLLKSQIYCSGKGYLGSDEPFYYRVIGKVQIHDYVVRYAAFLEGPPEKLCHVIFDAHCCKDNGEIFIAVSAQRSLLYDLSGKLVMGKNVSGQNRKFLPPDQSSQSVNCRDIFLNKVSVILPGNRIQR